MPSCIYWILPLNSYISVDFRTKNERKIICIFHFETAERSLYLNNIFNIDVIINFIITTQGSLTTLHLNYFLLYGRIQIINAVFFSVNVL